MYTSGSNSKRGGFHYSVEDYRAILAEHCADCLARWEPCSEYGRFRAVLYVMARADGRIKIGASIHPPSRRAQLQSHYGQRMELLHVIFALDAYFVERLLLRRLLPLCVEGHECYSMPFTVLEHLLSRSHLCQPPYYSPGSEGCRPKPEPGTLAWFERIDQLILESGRQPNAWYGPVQSHRWRKDDRKRPDVAAEGVPT